MLFLQICFEYYIISYKIHSGHFDAQGNYIADKNDSEITDGWLDSVDWNKVPSTLQREKLEEDDANDKSREKINSVNVKKEMVAIMKPGIKTFFILGARFH